MPLADAEDPWGGASPRRLRRLVPTRNFSTLPNSPSRRGRPSHRGPVPFVVAGDPRGRRVPAAITAFGATPETSAPSRTPHRAGDLCPERGAALPQGTCALCRRRGPSWEARPRGDNCVRCHPRSSSALPNTSSRRGRPSHRRSVPLVGAGDPCGRRVPAAITAFGATPKLQHPPELPIAPRTALPQEICAPCRRRRPLWEARPRGDYGVWCQPETSAPSRTPHRAGDLCPERGAALPQGTCAPCRRRGPLWEARPRGDYGVWCQPETSAPSRTPHRAEDLCPERGTALPQGTCALCRRRGPSWEARPRGDNCVRCHPRSSSALPNTSSRRGRPSHRRSVPLVGARVSVGGASPRRFGAQRRSERQPAVDIRDT